MKTRIFNLFLLNSLQWTFFIPPFVHYCQARRRISLNLTNSNLNFGLTFSINIFPFIKFFLKLHVFSSKFKDYFNLNKCLNLKPNRSKLLTMTLQESSKGKLTKTSKDLCL